MPKVRVLEGGELAKFLSPSHTPVLLPQVRVLQVATHYFPQVHTCIPTNKQPATDGAKHQLPVLCPPLPPLHLALHGVGTALRLGEVDQKIGGPAAILYFCFCLLVVTNNAQFSSQCWSKAEGNIISTVSTVITGWCSRGWLLDACPAMAGWSLGNVVRKY